MKYIYIDGERCQLVSPTTSGVIVKTKDGDRKARACYIGWTFAGFTFKE
jgi:hypothetical protein